MSGSKRSEDAAEGLVALGTGSNKKAKADTTRMINWTNTKEDFLLVLYKRQLQQLGNQKSIKLCNWKALSDGMKEKFPDDADLITTEKCRGKYHKLKEDYIAYHLIQNTSGLGSGSDESVWRDLAVKNPGVLKFRDTEFAHYARMFEVLGNNIFTGEHMQAPSDLVTNENQTPVNNTPSTPALGTGISSSSVDSAVTVTGAATGTTSSTNTGTTSSTNINRGGRGNASTMLGSLSASLTGLGAEFTAGMSKMADAIATVEKEDGPQTSAMEFFHEGKPLADMMEVRESRIKIEDYLNIKENALFFLRCQDKHKRDFVEGRILGKE